MTGPLPRLPEDAIEGFRDRPSWSPLSPVVRPQDMEVAAAEPPARTSSHLALRPSPRRRTAGLAASRRPPATLHARVHPWSRLAGLFPPGRPASLDSAPRSSPLSSPSAPRHHPRSAGRRGHCLAAPPLAHGDSYSRPAPPLRRASRPTFSGPRATGPPAAGVPELAPRSGPPVTSLGDVTPRGRTACTPLPGGHDLRTRTAACDFGGQKEEAAPLPGPCGHFAVRPRVSGGPHWQALFGPLVVELFAVAVSLRAIPGPGLVAGPPGRPGGCSPRQRGCAARDRDINPDSRRRLSPSPPRRDSHPLRIGAAPPPRARGACPRRPRSSGLIPSGRTARLSRSSLVGSAGLGGRSPRRTGRAGLPASGATSRPLIAAGQAASLSPVGGGVPGRGPAIGAAACGAVRAGRRPQDESCTPR